MKNPNFNLPNLLSGYRIVIFPFIFWLIWSGQEVLFARFLVFNLLTDIADGWIARRFNLQTEFGARLDSTADYGTFILAIYGVFAFKWPDFEPNQWGFWLFLVLFIAEISFILWKYGRVPGFHLWSFKVTGYVQGLFFGVLFLWGFQPILFWLAMLVGCYACLETIAVARLLDQPMTDVKHYFFVKKLLEKKEKLP
jgi:cardiolipin synthase (CMP-forming)